MHPSSVVPCSVCGYHAPARPCPHCGGAPRERSLSGAPPRGSSAILCGARAPLVGFATLCTTPRTKRLLVAPLVLTVLLYGVLFAVFWRTSTAAWSGFVVSEPWRTLLAGGTFVLSAFVFAFVFAWTFALAYQTIAGPFLDTIQGRIEERWFGSDPRATLTRRAEEPRAFAARLFQFAAVETRSLLVSLHASLVAALMLLAFVWLLFVPLVGHPTFGAIAGFASGIALLDIACARRDWTLGRRLSFARRHCLPLAALGLVTSVFFLVPFLGPIVGIPSAAIGGQWLVCRLDKARI